MYFGAEAAGYMATPPPPLVQHLDQSCESVMVTGVVPGATLNLYCNGTQIASAVATSGNLRVPLSRALIPGGVVTAIQSVGGLASTPSTPVVVELNHTTHQFNRQRTGWNPYETSLNVTNVPTTFGFLFAQPVDDQVYAQPLYVQNIEFTSRGQHGKTVTTIVNVLYVVTENGSVYAFDADNFVPPLLRRSLVPSSERVVRPTDLQGPVKQRVNDPGTVGAVVGAVVGAIVGIIYGSNGNNYRNPCDNVSPQICITATPVIDRATNTLFVTAKTANKDGTKFHWRLYALDLTTLLDQQPPVEIQASVPGLGDGSPDGMVTFDAQWQLNRPALLLSRGIVYLAFGSHCDYGTYHGWVMAYDAATLKMLAAFNTSPDHDSAGVWLSGCGPAADDDGSIYVATGNGPFSPRIHDYGQSVLKLKLELVSGRPDPGVTQVPAVAMSVTPSVYEFTLVDFFTPYDWQHLNPDWDPDADLGLGGVMLLPPQPLPISGDPSPRSYPPPASPPNLLFACGKNRGIYLLDPANLGKWTPNDDGLLQKRPQTMGTEVFGGPAYFASQTRHFVYYCGNKGPLRGFSLAGAALSPASQSTETFWGPDNAGGAIPTVSSNGSTPGSGLVWVVGRRDSMHLFAYDATDVAVKLFEGVAGPWNNPGGSPFVVPTVINGKVYVGTANQVAFFGLGGIRNIRTGLWGSVSSLLNRLSWEAKSLGVVIRRGSTRSYWQSRRRKHAVDNTN